MFSIVDSARRLEGNGEREFHGAAGAALA